MPMTWKDLIDAVELKLKEAGLSGDKVEINYVDISQPRIHLIDIEIDTDNADPELSIM